MIHSNYITLQDIRLELGIDMEASPENTKLLICFNPLMCLFNFTMFDKTVDDVTCALLNTPYRNEIHIDNIEYFEDKKDYVSKQLWITTNVLNFLLQESLAPFVWEDIVKFITDNEQELIKELRNSLTKEE